MTPNGFDFLGVAPRLGRVFDYRDVAPGAPPVAVMNHRAWVTRFGADPGVIGRTLVLDGQPYTVIGVMPPRFEWNIADLWLPAAMQRSDDPQTRAGARAFQPTSAPVSRRRGGSAVERGQARARRRAAERLPARLRFGIIPSSTGWCASSAARSMRSSARSASCCVIACCNVANMLLARDDPRARNHDSRGDRRQPRPHRPAAARREVQCSRAAARRRMPDGARRHRRARRLHAAAGRALGDRDRSIGRCSCSRSRPQRWRRSVWTLPALQRRGGTWPSANTTARSDGNRRQTRTRAGLVVARWRSRWSCCSAQDC